ncbi:hypothetical protein [Burkholderia perseverans]|uniref:hypothetical protein n=1 Tax=Burkholderia perseverans TaxID=2615214 RepID=UPI001FF03D09|nr:hypothetical protein [Burkholderia perseverans]
MTVIIAGRSIAHADHLTEPTRLALSFVDGGADWLAWAGTTHTARYEYPDETRFLDGVQQGLHASPFALLPRLGLLLSPVKLLTLDLADVRTLARAEAGDDSVAVAARAHAILAAHRIVTQDDLRAGTAFLEQLGVASAPLFQAIGMADGLVLAGLPALTAPPEWRREAAGFAVRHARTIPEYGDLYRLHLDRAAQLGDGATALERDAAAGAALAALLPALYGALDCPQVETLIGPPAVAAVVAGWLANGRLLGFPRLSLGAQQIVRHGAYHGETGDAARHVVDHYLRAAAGFLAGHPVERGVMGQDGATCAFPIEGATQHAVLRLGHDGLISLAAFGPRPVAAGVR